MSTTKTAMRQWLESLDTYANATYGYSLTSAVATGTCVSCGRPAYPFATAESAARYPRIGLCEHCQNAKRSKADTVVPFDQNYRTDTR